MAFATGCSSYEGGLLHDKPRDAGAHNGGHVSVDGGDAAAGDARTPDVDATMGMMGGAGGSGAADGGNSGVCHPNPDPNNEVCTMICPERCNGMDDDCDRKIDEDEASNECQHPHTQAVCTRDKGCVVTGCSDGYRDCNGMGFDGCEIEPDDPKNCGKCGNACSVTHGTPSCVSGKCVRDSCATGYDDCDSDHLTCETRTNTLDDCGSCGMGCNNVPNADPSCTSGACGVGACHAGFADCDKKAMTGCEQDLSTLDNCGGCGMSCDLPHSDDECVDQHCLAKDNGCDTGFGECDQNREDGCEPLTTDTNCGGCDMRCDLSLPHSVAPTACNAGTCELHCEDGYGDCDGKAFNGCEVQLITLSDCGKCGMPCALDHAVPTCSTGTCAVLQCDTGFGNCTGGDADGCETPTDTVAHCGTCQTTCNSNQTCSGGNCSDVNCAVAPYDSQCGGAKCGNCDNDTTCETDLASDLQNCGTCGNACTPTQGATLHGTIGCTPQGCKATTCDVGYADCDNDYHNGCEQSLSTLTSCGMCGKTCAIANATATCATGSCEVATCNTDYADCDNDKKSCESQLNTPSKCGGCNAVCMLTNAVEGCGGTPGARACTITACDQSYYKNCDNMTQNGCEIDTRSDKLNCGGCGTQCDALPNVAATTCTNSACNVTMCKPNYGDCTSAAGCETTINTTANCGSCGNNCDVALVNTSSTSCDASTLTCKIGNCKTGFANCDNMQSTGCETSTTTTTNCGSCGNNCGALPNVATTSCSGGTTCAITTCATNFADCDGVASNGCERDTRTPAMGGLGPCLPETNCTHFTSGTHEYYFCPTVRQWSDARAHCQLQRYGDLVQVGDSTENAFVQSHITAANWIGHSDQLVQGLWLWSFNGVPFWRGTSTGMALDGNYNNWDNGEPNNSGDCGQIYNTNGKLDDTTCTATKPYVCEVYPDGCPSDANKYDPGQCGCGNADVDADSDGYAACKDACPNDANKLAAGICGCGIADVNTDGDSKYDCQESCPTDPNKLVPGICGCGVADTDTDADTFADCVEMCDTDPAKQDPGVCGCGVADTDSDSDGTPNCNDMCPNDPGKLVPGTCGCGTADTDSDSDGTPNCNDGCPNDAAKTAAGQCGCGTADTDSDSDGAANCHDGCPSDPAKIAAGACGCGVADTNSDGDTQADCNETCDLDANKLAAGTCGCGTPDYDTDGDGTPNCTDTCPFDSANSAGCFKRTPSNIDTLGYSFASSPSWVCSGTTTTFDTTAGTVTAGCASTPDITNNVPQTRPGLIYGKIAGGWDTATANPGNLAFDTLGPTITELNTEVSTGQNERWVDNTTYIYSGEIYITSSGVASFMEHIDDYVYLKIDNTVVLNDTAWTTPTAGKFTGTPGWHTFELRVWDCCGGQGPSAQAPTGLPAFGYSPTDTGGSTNFANYTWPHNLDGSTASLFRASAGGPNVMVVRLKGLSLTSNAVFKITGNKPIVFLVQGNVTIDSGAKIDAGGSGGSAGPGGNSSLCTGSIGGVGTVSGDGGGGGGGGFGTTGGKGGAGNNQASTAGSAGAVSTDADLSPLRGGCAGGKGAGSSNANAGAGGGAVQITAGGTITIGTSTNTAIISSNGGYGGGQPNNSNCTGDGGDGGGSGGGILLEASSAPTFGSGGVLRAHGGGGGGGTECTSSSNGQDGHVTDDTAASGGAGEASSDNGGNGGLCKNASCATSANGATAISSSRGAGGGGGGGGRIVVSCPTCAPPAPTAPDTNCSYFAYNGHGYYFCTNDKSWTAARDACRANTTKMQLVRIDSSGENSFVVSHITTTNWFGANDLTTENTWRWSEYQTNDGPQFWSGLAANSGGTAQNGLYNNWNTGEPNNSGNAEDCAEIFTTGLWNDNNCTTLFDWVCEYTP